jgi:hypothetical protein
MFPGITLFLRNTKQYNHLSCFLQNSPLVQLDTDASDCKGVVNIPGSNFVKAFSALPFLMMSLASQKQHPFIADFT